MTPSIRSSTPSRSSSRTPPRKPHRCTKCGRPRAGHPRSGCPYSPSPGRETDPENEPELSQALGSLQIIPSVDDKDAVRARHASLAPISTQQLGAHLSHSTSRVTFPSHSLFTIREDSPADGLSQRMRRIVRWQETLQVITEDSAPSPPPPPSEPDDVVVPPPQKPRSVMPGTFLTPNSSILGTPTASPPPDDITAHPTDYYRPCPSQSTYPSTRSRMAPRPLARSLSIEERNAFLNGLVESAHAPPASAFTIPMSEIYQIQRSAAKVGFHSRVIPSPDDEEGGDGWLILGSDDKAVQRLFEGVDGTNRRTQAKSGGGLRAVAGGAVVGAVATLTGLAFS